MQLPPHHSGRGPEPQASHGLEEVAVLLPKGTAPLKGSQAVRPPWVGLALD